MELNTDWAWPWWSAMVVVNIINLFVCLTIFQRSRRAAGGISNIISPYHKQMLIMGLIFTLVAAYRSVFVSRYLTQFAWFDSVANSSLLIRMFAIAAEMSFAGLFAFAMLQLNKDLPGKNHTNPLLSFMAKKSPYLLILCIFVAQFFATSGLITKNNTLFAIEETLWSAGFLCILPLAFVQFRRVQAITDESEKQRLRMLITSAKVVFGWCVIYCSYGLFFHLPVEFWGEGATSAAVLIDTTMPVVDLGFSAVADAFFIVNETKAYKDWGFGFLFWHSSYFSVCVWLAIFLMRAPRALEAKA